MFTFTLALIKLEGCECSPQFKFDFHGHFYTFTSDDQLVECEGQLEFQFYKNTFTFTSEDQLVECEG